MFNYDDDRLKHLVASLFVEDREDIEGPYFKDTVKNVEEVVENDEDGMREISFTYAGAHSLEDEAFPTGEIIAMCEVTPGECDRYSNEVLVRYDNLIEGYTLLFQGNHSSAGNSDESWEGYISGRILIVPEDRVDEQIKIHMGHHQKRNLDDAESRLANLISQVRDIDPEVMEGSSFMDKIRELNRVLIR